MWCCDAANVHLCPPSLLHGVTMGVFGVIAEELGLTHIRDAHSRRDVALLLVSRFIRMAGSVLFLPSGYAYTSSDPRQLVTQIRRFRPGLDPLPAPHRHQRPRRRALPLGDPPRRCRAVSLRHLDRRCARTSQDAGARLDAHGYVGSRVLLVPELCSFAPRGDRGNHLAKWERDGTVCRP